MIKSPEELMAAFCDAADRFDLEALVALHELPLVVIGRLETKTYQRASEIREMYERVQARFAMIAGGKMRSSFTLHKTGSNLCFAETDSTVVDADGNEITKFNLAYAVRELAQGYRINLVAIESNEAAQSPVLDCTIEPATTSSATG